MKKKHVFLLASVCTIVCVFIFQSGFTILLGMIGSAYLFSYIAMRIVIAILLHNRDLYDALYANQLYHKRTLTISTYIQQFFDDWDDQKRIWCEKLQSYK